jgi:hypothetical protein
MDPKTESCLYVVLNVDTEGPATETLTHTFQRVRNIYGIDLEPTLANLQILQKGEIEGIDEETRLGLSVMLAPDRLQFVNNWEQMDEMLDKVMSDRWRKDLPDSNGDGYVFNFYIRDLVGYDFNPRRMAIGYHQVYDFYREKIASLKTPDVLYWHYHAPGFIRHAYLDGLNLSHTNFHVQNLARRVIERLDFPACFRPGMDHIRPDHNLFLEMWIPFDYSNQSVEPTPEELSQKDNEQGRYGDWRKAPRDWSIYNPDLFDYQKPGNMKRSIARCLYSKGRMRVITQQEVDKAFARVEGGDHTIMSYLCHDSRDMTDDIAAVNPLIRQSSKAYPNVKFLYCNAVDAMRRALRLEAEAPAQLDVSMKANKLVIASDKALWGPQPFFCFRTWDEQFFHDNLDKQSDTEWTYTFDWQSIDLRAVSAIGVATNDDYGNTTIVKLDLRKNETEIRHRNVEAAPQTNYASN